MGQPVVQWQIITKAPEQSAEFYRSMFDWDINANNQLGYRTVDTGSEDGINGGIWPAPPEAAPFVQLFIEVEDVVAATARAAELGGSVLVPRQMLPDGDEMAILRDSQGMSFGVVRSAR